MIVQKCWCQTLFKRCGFERYRCDTLKVFDALMQHFKIRVAEKFQILLFCSFVNCIYWECRSVHSLERLRHTWTITVRLRIKCFSSLILVMSVIEKSVGGCSFCRSLLTQWPGLWYSPSAFVITPSCRRSVKITGRWWHRASKIHVYFLVERNKFFAK